MKGDASRGCGEHTSADLAFKLSLRLRGESAIDPADSQ
jgi:hypothetical protein